MRRNDRNGCSSERNLGVARRPSEIVVFLDRRPVGARRRLARSALAILRDHREIGAVEWSAGWFDAARAPGATVDKLPERGMSGAHAVPTPAPTSPIAPPPASSSGGPSCTARGFDEAA
jgi:hypothetical protein